MPRDLPALPSSIMAPGGRVRVLVKRTGTVRAEDDDAWGTWEKHTRTIEIDGGPSLRHQWWALFHELTHVAIEDAGIANLLTDAQQEALCYAIATARVRERFG